MSQYFCLCFACGSEDSNCGHREPELRIWWASLGETERSRVGYAAKMPVTAAQPAPREAEDAPEAVTPPKMFPIAPRAGKREIRHIPQRDPYKLARKRMPWPEETGSGVTPETVWARKNG